MINSRQTDSRDRVQTTILLVVAIIVFVVIYIGGRAYEERVVVQAVRLAIEHRVDEVDNVQASQAKDIDSLWSIYGPQEALTKAEFYRQAEMIATGYQSYLSLFVALMAAGLTFVTLGMLFNTKARTRRYHKLIAEKEQALQQSQEKLASVAIIDELTGLINGRHFNDILAVECGRAVREFSPLTLMLIAIDHLDATSLDGEVAEQQVCLIADALKEAISRPGDQVARIATDRFALILPSTNEQSPILAERLCQKVRDIELKGQHLSISIGTSTLQPSTLLTAENILAQTEVALTEARLCGGGQIRANTENSVEIPVILSN